MNIKIGEATVSDVTRTDPKTNRKFTVTQVCVAIENTGSTEDVLEIDIKARARKYKTGPRKVFEVVCRKKKITVGPRIDLGQASANGYVLICCDVPGNIAADVFNFGGDYLVAVGRKRGSDGDVSDIIDTQPIALPTRVSMDAGSRLRYGEVVGVGFENAVLTFDAAVDLPPGWRIEFADPLPAHDSPDFVPFNVEARPGAYEGETATLVLRTFMPGPEDRPLMIEEGNFQFTVGKKPDCCACVCDTNNDGASSALSSDASPASG